MSLSTLLTLFIQLLQKETIAQEPRPGLRNHDADVRHNLPPLSRRKKLHGGKSPIEEGELPLPPQPPPPDAVWLVFSSQKGRCARRGQQGSGVREQPPQGCLWGSKREVTWPHESNGSLKSPGLSADSSGLFQCRIRSTSNYTNMTKKR